MRKVLVANRGEIACRVFRACRANNLSCVAVYSDAGRGRAARGVGGRIRPHRAVVPAGELFERGKNSGRRAQNRRGRGSSRLRVPRGKTRTLPRRWKAPGLRGLAPRPQSIRDMGNKSRARALAESAGVPVLPGTGRVSAEEPDELLRAAEQAGFPLLVKAAAGGGGIGMRTVAGPEQLTEAVKATGALAARAFGDGDVFLERHVARARHVEAQVFGDGAGGAVHFGERECSIQRRFQKIIEESPSPGVSAETRARMCEAAVALAKSQKYAGAGTVEFIHDDDRGEFFFLEMNTRIQVEHPVTEMVWGADLVGMQLRLAGGGGVDAASPSGGTGHAIECRLCAENPAKMFLPSPGKLETLCFPAESEDLRVDSGYREGDLVTPFYDSLLAKIIVRGKNREDAAEKMSAALAEVKIEGAQTNLEFLARCASHPAFRAGETNNRLH